MNCPACGEDALIMRGGCGPESETGHDSGDYARCEGCGERFDVSDLDRISELLDSPRSAA